MIPALRALLDAAPVVARSELDRERRVSDALDVCLAGERERADAAEHRAREFATSLDDERRRAEGLRSRLEHEHRARLDADSRADRHFASAEKLTGIRYDLQTQLSDEAAADLARAIRRRDGVAQRIHAVPAPEDPVV